MLIAINNKIINSRCITDLYIDSKIEICKLYSIVKSCQLSKIRQLSKLSKPNIAFVCGPFKWQ